MKEILYKFHNRGMYLTEDNTSFGDDSQIKITVEPHDFSLSVGGEVLRNTTFEGCVIVATNDGSVVFYDNQNNAIGRADKTDSVYKNAVFKWEQNYISVQFGYMAVVDYYPNCDGESDRYGEEWVTTREVSLNLTNNSVEIKAKLPN